MSGNGTALLGLPDFERLQLLNINFQTTNIEQKWRQVNEQRKQDRSKLIKNMKIDQHSNHKINAEIHYFIAGLEMEADRMASPITMQIVHNDYGDLFTGIGCFKGTFCFRVKMVQSYIRPHPGM